MLIFYWSAPDLIELSKTTQLYNIKYDAGHWNDIGAFYATHNLLDIIKKDFPDIENPELEDYTLTYEHVDSLPVSTFPIDEKIPVLNHSKYQPELDNKYLFGEFVLLLIQNINLNWTINILKR